MAIRYPNEKDLALFAKKVKPKVKKRNPKTPRKTSVATRTQKEVAVKSGKALNKRAEMSTAFLSDMQDMWNEVTNNESGTTQGKDLLRLAAEESPLGFCKMVAGIMPKEMHKLEQVNVNFVDALKMIQGDAVLDITPDD